MPCVFAQFESRFPEIRIRFPKSGFEKHQEGIFRIISRHGTGQWRFLRLNRFTESGFFGHG